MGPKNIDSELKAINEKLSHVLTKNDSTFIKEMIKETILELKESILAPVIKQVEVLESTLFNTNDENDKLKKEIQTLKKEIEDKDKTLNTEKQKTASVINNHEQYSRVNNVRINGLPGDMKDETSNQTAGKVLDMISKKLDINMPYHEIDIAHRLGQFVQGQNRRVIVRFVRRQTKQNIMSIKKKLKGSGFSIFEDLTPLNAKVLASARKKQPDEVEHAWAANGKLFLQWKADSRVQQIKSEDYESWLDLPWPEDENTQS